MPKRPVAGVQLLTGDYPGAATNLQEALAIGRDLGDRRGQASALADLGNAALATGDYSAAARDLQEALDSWAGAPRPTATPPKPKQGCGRLWRSSSESARPKPLTCPPNWTRAARICVQIRDSRGRDTKADPAAPFGSGDCPFCFLALRSASRDGRPARWLLGGCGTVGLVAMEAGGHLRDL
jgi:tetratricopeptide (TPR) repeat protein